jgi:hypothetical protein
VGDSKDLRTETKSLVQSSFQSVWAELQNTIQNPQSRAVKIQESNICNSQPTIAAHTVRLIVSDSLHEDKRALNTKDLHYTKQDICMLHRFIYFQDRLIIEKESGAREGKGKRRRKGMYNIEEDRKR